MSASPPNVASMIPWKRLLEHLAVEAGGGALPCTARCPSCRKVEMTLYQDTIQKGEWHFCSLCGARGDNLELAARVLNCPPEVAAEHLVSVGLLGRAAADRRSLADYRSWYVDRRAKTDVFWQMARLHFQNSGSEAVAFKQFLEAHNSLDWDKRGGRFVGASPSRELLEYVAPHRWIRHNRNEWKDAEAGVLAFEDLPGRLSAFLFVRGGRGEGLEKIYRPAFGSLSRSMIRRDVPGVAMLEAASRPPEPALGDTLFVFLDPLVAARTHVRHLGTSDDLLPVVGCWPEAPVPPVLLTHAPGRDVVVWAPEADADALRYAMTLNARLITHDERMEAVRKTMNRFGTSRPWLEIMRQQAVPWRKHAYAVLAGLPAGRAGAVLFAAGLTDEARREFVEGAPAALKRRLIRLYPSAAEARRVISIDGVQISEDETGWTRVAREEYVSEVAVRVETVYSRPGESPQQWYRGRLLYRGQQLPFCVSQEEFKANPLRWASGKVAAQGWGVPRYKESWSKKTLELSMAFEEPGLVVLPERYGWNEADQDFVFPCFKVGRLGEVVPNEAPPLPMRYAPAASLRPPVPLCSDELERLKDCPAREVLWPALASVLYNLLAPVYGYEQRGVVVAGRGAGDFLRVVEAAGCAVMAVNWRGVPAMKELREAEQSGSWPLAVRGRPQRSALWAAWFEERHNVIIETDELIARVAHCRGDWDMVLAGGLRLEGEVTPGELELVSRFVPDFIRHVSAGGWAGGTWGRDPMERVGAELAGLLAARGCPADEDVYALVGGLERGPAWRVQELMRVVLGLYDEGCFRVEQDVATVRRPAAVSRPDTRPVVLFTTDAVWVPKAGLNDALHAKHHLTLDLTAVGEKLLGLPKGAFVGEEVRRGEVGWRFDRRWWEKDLVALRGGGRTELKLAAEG